MVVIETWMQDLIEKLKEVFAARLLFAGLQGSYRREEATNESDIDAVVVLDTLAMADLAHYKTILDTMPERENACGFVSGKEELINWPKQELFQFKMDTQAYFGELDAILPKIGRNDIVDGVRAGASGIYHNACHSFLHGKSEDLKGLYKSAFFILQSVHYLKSGEYVGSKREILPLLEGSGREVLSISADWDNNSIGVVANPEKYYGLLIEWSSDLLIKSL